MFHLAARVHGIGGNKKYKADILYDNIMINTNVIEQARRVGVEKLLPWGQCVTLNLKARKNCLKTRFGKALLIHRKTHMHSERLMLARRSLTKRYGVKSAFAISSNLYGPRQF